MKTLRNYNDPKNRLLLLFIVINLYFIGTSSTYVRYWADDFCTAGVLENLGFWQSLTFWWNNWSGRYSFNFIINIFEILGPWVVNFLPILTILLLSITLIPIFGTITSFFITLLIAINSPNMVQTHFWQTGLITYTLPFVFVNLILVKLTNIWYTKKQNSSNLLILMIFSFIAGGFSESLASLVFVLSVFIIFSFYIFKLKSIKYIIFPLLFTVFGAGLSLLIAYLSPGNHARAVNVDKPETVSFVILSAMQGSLWFINKIFHSKVFIISTLSLFTYFLLGNRQHLFNFGNVTKSRNIVKYLGLFVLLPVITVFALFLVSYATTSYLPPERTQFIAVYLIFIEFIFFVMFFSVIIKNYFSANIYKISLKMGKIVLILSIFTLLINTGYTFQKLKSELATYAYKWDVEERSLLKRNSILSDVITIKNIEPVGKFDGFTNNGGWVLSCMKDYFGIKSLVVK